MNDKETRFSSIESRNDEESTGKMIVEGYSRDYPCYPRTFNRIHFRNHRSYWILI